MEMRVWGKKAVSAGTASVAAAALAGSSHEGLLREALRALTQVPCPDRVGIWLEAEANAHSPSELSGAFHGFVWDRTAREESPLEWKILSLEPPLPEQLLLRAEPFEQNLDDSVQNAVIGQLVGLRRALWVPIADPSRVRGLLLLGSVSNSLAPFLDRAKSVAAELALALQAKEQFRAARIRIGELNLARHIMESGSDRSSLDRLLNYLVEDCVRGSEKEEGLGASFAAISTTPPPKGRFSPTTQPDFRWRSGDKAWTSSLGADPFAKLWRRALETRKVAGSDAPVAWPHASVVRVVALPSEAEGQLLGVLMAGFPAGGASIATLDRLELRARLAGFALLRGKRREEEERRTSAEQSLLDLVGDPVFLLDDSGRITATSRGARELLRREGQAAVLPSGHISDLFCGHDRERLRKWFQQVLESSFPALGVKRETPQAELQNGVKVSLELAPRLPGQPVAVLLEPRETLGLQPQANHAESELQNVIEWVEEGVVLFDAHENVRAVNMRFEQMAGLAPEESGKLKTLEEWIARLAELAVEPAQFAERWRDLARNIRGGVREPLQMALPVPRVLERAARPVLDSIGRPVGRVEIYRDLTAQRVFHSKLLQTEKLAALGQMVSGVAHELSSPLTSILGYSQRLLTGANALGQTEEARQIHQEAERARNDSRAAAGVLKSSGDARNGTSAFYPCCGKNSRRNGPGSRPSFRSRRWGAASAGADQPSQQRAPCPGRAEQWRRDSAAHAKCERPPRAPGSRRQRTGRSAGDPGADLRSLFYHQTCGSGNRFGPFHRSQCGARARRAGSFTESAAGRRAIPNRTSIRNGAPARGVEAPCPGRVRDSLAGKKGLSCG